MPCARCRHENPADATFCWSAMVRCPIDILQSWCPDLLVSDIGRPDEARYALIRTVQDRG